MKNRRLNYILLFIFTTLVLYFSLKDNFYDVINYILKMNPLWLAYSVLLMVIYWLLKSLIIKRYVNSYNKKYSFIDALKLEMETMFFNGITPFSSGGQPFQVLSLKKDGVRISDGTNIIVIISFLHQFALFTLMSISIIDNRFIKLFPTSNTIRNLSILGFVINVIFMLFLLLVMFNKKFNKNVIKNFIKLLNKIRIVKNKEIVIDKWNNYIERLNESSKIIKSDKLNFVLCYIYTVVALFAQFMVPLTIARGMGVSSFGIFETMITTSYVTMIGMFVPIPGGTGGLEYAFTSLYGVFIAGSVLNSLMLVWRFITYYLGIIIGGIVLNIRKKRSVH